MTPDEKQAFANEAEKALAHPLVQNVMTEFMDNIGIAMEGLPRYGITKVAHYAATVARAQALGIDIEELRTTASEHMDHAMDIAARMLVADKEVIFVTPDVEAQ